MIPPIELVAARLERATMATRAQEVDALVLTHPPNIFYLTGFAGSAGLAVLSDAGLTLVVDGRYRGAVDDLPLARRGLRALVVPSAGSADRALFDLLIERRARRVAFESAHVPFARFQAWQRLSGNGVVLVPADGIVESLRLRKDSYEQDTLREAARRLGAVLQGVLVDLRPGLREWDVASGLEAGMRRAGFARTAFDTIVASGPHAALPHHRASERPLTPGDLVVLDFGGVYNGYCVDLSRTVSIGQPSARAAELYTAVSRAQEAALAATRPGARASDVDAAARRVLTDHGFGDAFTHATGHGLGLEVHEAPRIGPPPVTKPGESDDAPVALEAGMVITIEPGGYVPGLGGVRIEDDVLVTDDGCERLTTVGRDLTIVDC